MARPVDRRCFGHVSQGSCEWKCEAHSAGATIAGRECAACELTFVQSFGGSKCNDRYCCTSMAGCSSLHSNEHLVGVRREAPRYPSFRRRRVPDPFREPAAWDFTFVSSKRKASGCNGQLVWQAGVAEYFKKPVREGQPEPRQYEGQWQIWLVSSNSRWCRRGT
jgi:hypothetical protein